MFGLWNAERNKWREGTVLSAKQLNLTNGFSVQRVVINNAVCSLDLLKTSFMERYCEDGHARLTRHEPHRATGATLDLLPCRNRLWRPERPRNAIQSFPPKQQVRYFANKNSNSSNISIQCSFCVSFNSESIWVIAMRGWPVCSCRHNNFRTLMRFHSTQLISVWPHIIQAIKR